MNIDNTSPLVSVIVPVYNVEDCISYTLNSARRQTYKNIQVVMVDDGSCDGSSDICAKMSEQDSRFEYYRKKNGGLSSARNYGLQHVRGDYITFLDGDDVLAPNAIEFLIREAIRNDVDLVTCGYKKISISDLFDVPQDGHSELLSGTDLLKRMLTLSGESGSAWAKLYGRKLQHLLDYPEGQLFEDFGVETAVFKSVERVVVSDAPLYGYVTRKGSITGQSSYGMRHVNGMKASLTETKRVLAGNQEMTDFLICFEAICLLRVASKLSKSECSDINEYRGVIAEAKRTALAVVFNPNLSLKWRSRCLLFAISKSVHNALYKLYGLSTGLVVG